MAVIDRGRNTINGILFGVLLKAVQIICPFVTRTAIIYVLGMEYLGLNSLFISILQVLNLAELGVGSAMVFSMYKPIADDDEERICALMRLYRTYYRVIGGIVLALGLSLVPFLPSLIKGAIPEGIDLIVLYLMNLTATVLSYWLFAHRNSLLNAYQRTDVVSKITAVTSLIQYVLQLVVVIAFKNYYAFVAVALIMQVVNNISLAIASKRMFPQLAPAGKLASCDIQALNRKIRDLFTGQFGSVITTAGNSLVASTFLGLVALGIYQNYMLIITSTASLFAIVYRAMLAGLGNAFAVEADAANYKRFKSISYLVFYLIAIGAACIFTLTQPFMEVWVGSSAMLGMESVACLVLYFVAYEIVMLMSLFKDATGMWGPDKFRPAISGIVNIVLSVILVQVLGTNGILIALVITTWLISVVWILHVVFRYVIKAPLTQWIKSMILYCILMALGVCLSFLVCAVTPVGGVAGLAVKMVITLAISSVIFLVPTAAIGHATPAFEMVNGAMDNRLVLVIKLANKVRWKKG